MKVYIQVQIDKVMHVYVQVCLNPGVMNHPVITYAHLIHVDQVAKSPYKKGVKLWTPRAQRRDWWENEVFCFIYSKSMKTQHLYFRYLSNMDLSIKILFSSENCYFHTRRWPVQARVHLAANELKEYPQIH